MSFSPFSGTSLSGRRRAGSAPARVTVVGGGIVGLAISHALARRGAEVILLEAGRLGAAATADSFAWINATFDKQPQSYFDFNRLGIRAWKALQEDLPQLDVRWGGSLEWMQQRQAATVLASQVRRHRQWGYRVAELNGDQICELEPTIRAQPVIYGCHCRDEGHVDPGHAIGVLAAAARAGGVEIHTGTRVTAIEERGPAVVCQLQGGEPVESEALVIACGARTDQVAALAGIDVPLKDSPGLLVHTAPTKLRLQHVILSPDVHIRQTRNGCLVAGLDFGGGFGGRQPEEAAGEIFRLLSDRLRELDVTLDHFTLGRRPMPADELPILGRAPGKSSIYLAVLHSGITLAPLVGSLVAAEVLEGWELEILQAYRLERFSELAENP